MILTYALIGASTAVVVLLTMGIVAWAVDTPSFPPKREVPGFPARAAKSALADLTSNDY